MRRWISIILFLLGALGILYFRASQKEFTRSYVRFPSGVEVQVDIADNYAERIQGLSGREGLGEYEGLLFLHDIHKVQKYWMKDMNFAIDIVWIDSNIVVGFEEDIQSENPPMTIYTSHIPVDKVFRFPLVLLRNTV